MKRELHAILGGSKEIKTPLKHYKTIGEEEKKAVIKVIDGGTLSGFIGADCPEFYGGENIKSLEKNWCDYFNVKHAITMNSATSCLYASIAAARISPGDEILVTPTTMTATVTGIILYQAIPVFVDIDEDTFCINVEKIEEKITHKTKAIIGVDIYGNTANWSRINEIATKHNLFLIEDSSQSIGGIYKNKMSGTLANIGIYSLNRHKHIHCGEGGVCVTDDDDLALRLKLIRNHGEAVVDSMGYKDISNIIGFNYRMTEIEASIAIEQLKKLKDLVRDRIKMCNKIIKEFSKYDFFVPQKISPLDKNHEVSTNIFYYLCFKVEEEALGMKLVDFVSALNAEGIPAGMGGYMPIYLQPMFQKKVSFNNGNFNKTKVNYARGICPVAERMWFEELFYIKVQNFIFDDTQIALISKALDKVLLHRKEISYALNHQ